jgi:hypothetical protein
MVMPKAPQPVTVVDGGEALHVKPFRTEGGNVPRR